MKIAITRPKEHLEASVELLKSKGFEVVASPMIGVSVRDDPEFEPFLSRVIDRRCDFVIFTSVNGVKFMLEKVDEARKQDFISALNDPAIKVVSMGPRTSEGLLSVGINPDMMPATFTQPLHHQGFSIYSHHGFLEGLLRSCDLITEAGS